MTLLPLVRAVPRGVRTGTRLIGPPRSTAALTYSKLEASGEGRVLVGLVPKAERPCSRAGCDFRCSTDYVGSGCAHQIDPVLVIGPE